MAGAQMPAVVSRAVEREVMPLLQQGFNSRTDPAGKPWKKPKRGNPPLEINGKGRRSYEVIRTIHQGRWAVMASNKAKARSGGAYYMAILQKGWRDRGGGQNEARKQVPEGKTLPARWWQRLQPAGRSAGTTWIKERCA
jgi:hypothetical protein